jgi:hypothetical protein
VPVDGFRLEERALVHRPSRTLVVADLVHNIGTPARAWTRVYAGAMGFYGRVALSRMLRWAAFSDRASARRSVDNPVLEGAREALATAYAWLPARSSRT